MVSRDKPWAEIFLHSTLRFLQFVLAVAVAGVYGRAISSVTKPAEYVSSKWIYATVVAVLSALTTIAFVIPYVKRWIFWPWDFFLCVLWAAVVGIFARLNLDDHPTGGTIVKDARSAAFVDLTSMILWFGTGLFGAAVSFNRRRKPHVSASGQGENEVHSF